MDKHQGAKTSLCRLSVPMRHESDTVDALVGKWAARQHGVLSLSQLLACGMTKSGVARRTRAGRLYPVQRGVYAVGYPRLTHTGRCMAAALTYGSEAVVSHRSAAELWGLLPTAGGYIVVSVPGITGRRPRRGVHIHRSRTLTADAMTTRRGVPVTTPARTITDLRRAAKTKGCKAGVAPRELRQAIRQAGVLGLRLDQPEMMDRSRSELEYLFLRLCKRHSLQLPEVNAPIDSLLVDFLWREPQLIVETDGYKYHRGREAFEDDRDRDLRLRALGYEVVRLSYRQVTEEPTRVADLLMAILRRE